jgi:hypothetical protein
MPTLLNHIEDLDRMVKEDAEKDDILVQISVVWKVAATIEREQTNLITEHSQLQKEHAGLKRSQPQPSPDLGGEILRAKNEEIKAAKAEILSLMSENRGLNEIIDGMRNSEGENKDKKDAAEAALKDAQREISRLTKEVGSLKIMEEARKAGELGRNRGLGIFTEPMPPEQERDWPPMAVRTLQQIAEWENPSTAKGLAERLGYKIALMEHFLNEFRDADFISPVWDLEEGIILGWSASERGLAFLFKKGLLS